MAAVRHLGFLKIGSFSARILQRSKMRHRAKFRADRSNRCGDMAVYIFSKSSKFKLIVLALRRAKMHHHAKFCPNQSKRCGDMAVFDFSRWRPSAILDLLYACLDHPRSVFWWSVSLCKIWFESVQ